MLNSFRASPEGAEDCEQDATRRVEAINATLVALPITLSTSLSPFAVQHRGEIQNCPSQKYYVSPPL
jgi:hypothetical protein